MELPNKIYIAKAKATAFSLGNIGRATCYQNDLKDCETVEYTNLSDVWHDANKSTPIVDGAVFEYPIIIYAKLQGVLKVGIVIKPEQFAAITKLSVTKFDEVLWAYVRDLVPKFNE